MSTLELMIASTQFKTLFFFSSAGFYLTEIKRLDSEPTAAKSEVYRWLLISKQSSHILPLEFVSMEIEENQEHRTFVNASFEFSQTNGKLSILGNDIEFTNAQLKNIPEQVTEKIHNYLGSVSAHLQSSSKIKISLHPPKPSDASYFNDWIKNESSIRYSLTRFHQLTDEQEVNRWFFSTMTNGNSFSTIICNTDTNEPIGSAGLSNLNTIDKTAECFIFIENQNFWNKVIASVVTKEITAYGFKSLNLHRIFLTASAKNTHGIRAYQRAGFVHEGVMREAFFRNNERSDKVIMGLLRKEWKSLTFP
ncbi:MAG: GNAT family N-acetyltransferase [Xanthomonadaceae bacterium]|nr:GNAT family N-acetyltransferase [Xanthomonadaceae bacterium]